MALPGVHPLISTMAREGTIYCPRAGDVVRFRPRMSLGETLYVGESFDWSRVHHAEHVRLHPCVRLVELARIVGGECRFYVRLGYSRWGYYTPEVESGDSSTEYFPYPSLEFYLFILQNDAVDLSGIVTFSICLSWFFFRLSEKVVQIQQC